MSQRTILFADPDPQVLRALETIFRDEADLLAMKVGAHPRPDPELNLADQEPIERLELRNIELASLMVDLEDAIEAIHDTL